MLAWWATTIDRPGRDVTQMTPWREYQTQAAAFFRSLGLDAETDVTVQGVRTKHDIDVLVTISLAGFEITWVVECKLWKSAVSKLHVLALREIVSDLGADRGIILSENGFQSGAVEAANLTNVQVTSLGALAVSSTDALHAARLRDLYDRTETCRERYWDIPKDVRIDKGLRFGMGDEHMYSGARIIDMSSNLLSRAFRGSYPVYCDELLEYHLRTVDLPERLNGPADVVQLLEPLIAELEAKLAAV
jgi:restriction system protein